MSKTVCLPCQHVHPPYERREPCSARSEVMIECNIRHKKDKMWVCLPHAKEIMEDKPYYYIQKAHDPTLLERPDVRRRVFVVSHDEDEDEDEENFLSRPATEEEAREAEEAMKPPPHPPLPRLSDTCQRCGVNDNKVLPGLGYHHQECFVAKTEEEKKPKPEPKPVITYEIHGDTKVMLETYPNGLGLRKSVGIASKHEKVVILAKDTYDSVLNITGDHAKACEVMANIFIACYH